MATSQIVEVVKATVLHICFEDCRIHVKFLVFEILIVPIFFDSSFNNNGKRHVILPEKNRWIHQKYKL